jgi:hypothetical protein
MTAAEKSSFGADDGFLGGAAEVARELVATAYWLPIGQPLRFPFLDLVGLLAQTIQLHLQGSIGAEPVVDLHPLSEPNRRRAADHV